MRSILQITVIILFVIGNGCKTPTRSDRDPEVIAWSGEELVRQLNANEMWAANLVPFWTFEAGFLRLADWGGIVLWRTNAIAYDEAEALRIWREFQARELKQHWIDRGSLWQTLVDETSKTNRSDHVGESE